MKYRFKKQVQKKTSLAVIRAVSRLNDHAHQTSSRSIVWDGKSITHLSITS